MRLIDADERIEEVKRSPMDSKLKDCVLDVLQRAPTVSAAPENKPLTLEQLRQMCKPTLTQLQQTEPYMPVWIVTIANKKISCQITRGLIKADNRCKPPKEYIDAHMVGLLLSDYGKTWLAYAREPEGSAP